MFRKFISLDGKPERTSDNGYYVWVDSEGNTRSADGPICDEELGVYDLRSIARIVEKHKNNKCACCIKDAFRYQSGVLLHYTENCMLRLIDGIVYMKAESMIVLTPTDDAIKFLKKAHQEMWEKKDEFKKELGKVSNAIEAYRKNDEEYFESRIPQRIRDNTMFNILSLLR